VTISLDIREGLSDVEVPSVSSLCVADDTSFEALYQSIPLKRLNQIPSCCGDATHILKK